MKRSTKNLGLSLLFITVLFSCNKVEQLVNDGEWGKAVEYCESLEGEEKFDAYTTLGEAYLEHDSITRAMECFMKIENKDAIAGIGNMFLEKGKLDSALIFYDIYKHAPGYKSLADSLFERKLYKNAIAFYKLGEPGNAEYEKIATSFMKLPDGDSAVFYFVKSGKEEKAAYEMVADKFLENGWYDKAKELYGKTQISPAEYFSKIADAALNNGRLEAISYYLEAGLTQEAADEKINKAIEGGNYSIASKVALKNGDKTKARENFEKLLKCKGCNITLSRINASITGRLALDGYTALFGIFGKLSRNQDYTDLKTVLQKSLPEQILYDTVSVKISKKNTIPANLYINEKDLESVLKSYKADIYILEEYNWYERTKYQRYSWENLPLEIDIKHNYILYIPALDIKKEFTNKLFYKEQKDTYDRAHAETVQEEAVKKMIDGNKKVFKEMADYIKSML